MVVDKQKEFKDICKYLRLIGYKRIRSKKNAFSVPSDDSDDSSDSISLYERSLTYTKDNMYAQLYRVFWQSEDEDKPDQLIAFHIKVGEIGMSLSEEIYEIEEFFEYFKSEIREFKISKIIN